MKESKHLYHEGTYRLWLDTERGALHMKLNGDPELYYIPKNTKLYNRLLNDFFTEHAEEKK